MGRLVNYFKTDFVFHNEFLDNLETVIDTHPKLTEEQKNGLLKPLYEFYEYPKKLHKKEHIIKAVFKTVQDEFGLLRKIEPLKKGGE
jgi:hypothetical protein